MNKNDLKKLKDGAFEWWKIVSPESEYDRYKGERAELRRCHSTTDVMFIPAYHLLVQKTDADTNDNSEQLHQLAAIAWVLSWVDEDEKKVDKNGRKIEFAKSLGEINPATDMPKYSEMRFRRLLASDNWDDLSKQLIRAVKITNRRANVTDIIESILYWKHGTAKESMAISYYGSFKEKSKKVNKND